MFAMIVPNNHGWICVWHVYCVGGTENWHEAWHKKQLSIQIKKAVTMDFRSILNL